MIIDREEEEKSCIHLLKEGTVFTNEDNDVFMKTFDEDTTFFSFVNLVTGEYVKIARGVHIKCYPKFDASLKLHHNK